MSIFHTDSPVTGHEGNLDTLNRTDFAQRIGDSLKLKPNSDPLVVSLEGPWGYGKTSVLNLINHYYGTLKSKERPIVFSFNPWMIGNVENLVQEFIIQFSSAIGISSKAQNAQNAAKQLIAYSKIFNVLKFVPGAEPWASIIEKIISGVGNAADSIADLKELNVSEKRINVEKAIKKLNKPIVVFIDDLDRLPPNEVFQMIRAVKAITAFPRTAYVIAFERHYIENALKSHGVDDSGSYLDKIIQVRLHLPLISGNDLHTLALKEIQNLADINLTSFFDGDQDRLSEIYHLFAKPLIKTPRELKRIFNRLRFIEPAIRGNVCFSDIYALEILAIKAPYVYEHIRKCPWAYNAQEPEYEFNIDKPEVVLKRYEEERKIALDTVLGQDLVYVKELIEKLFPLLDTGFSGGSRDADYHFSKGHIASPDRLNFALTFGLPSGEIPSGLISKFFTDEKFREEISNEIDKEGRTERLIELILRASKEHIPNNPFHFVLCIARIAGTRMVDSIEDKPRDIFFAGPVRKLWWITEYTLEKVNETDRVTILNNLSNSTEFITIATYALDFCLRQHGYYDDKEKVSMENRWLTPSQLESFKLNWVNSVIEIINNRTIFKTTDPRHIFSMLRILEPKKTQEIVRPLIEKDSEMDMFFKIIGESGSDSIKGKFTEIDDSILEVYGGKELIIERVKIRAKEQIEDISLKAIYNGIITGGGYYLADGSKKRPF